MAFGALVTDNPLILGPHAPSLMELNLSDPNLDIYQWGQQRLPLCEKLVEMVTEIVDQRGCFRVSVPESISALGLVADLQTHLRG